MFGLHSYMLLAVAAYRKPGMKLCCFIWSTFVLLCHSAQTHRHSDSHAGSHLEQLVFVTVSSVCLPGTSSFVGEILGISRLT